MSDIRVHGVGDLGDLGVFKLTTNENLANTNIPLLNLPEMCGCGRCPLLELYRDLRRWRESATNMMWGAKRRIHATKLRNLHINARSRGEKSLFLHEGSCVFLKKLPRERVPNSPMEHGSRSGQNGIVRILDQGSQTNPVGGAHGVASLG